jgi:hypothetical protein
MTRMAANSAVSIIAAMIYVIRVVDFAIQDITAMLYMNGQAEDCANLTAFPNLAENAEMMAVEIIWETAVATVPTSYAMATTSVFATLVITGIMVPAFKMQQARQSAPLTKIVGRAMTSKLDLYATKELASAPRPLALWEKPALYMELAGRAAH